MFTMLRKHPRLWIIVALAVAAAISWAESNNPATAATVTHSVSSKTVCSKHPSEHNCPAILTGPSRWEVNQPNNTPSLYMGNGHAPYVTSLYWTTDQYGEGKATGILHTYKTSCLKGADPIKCAQYKMRVTVVLTAPKFHKVDPLDGGYYWSIMEWRYVGTGYAAPHWYHVSKGFWRNGK